MTSDVRTSLTTADLFCPILLQAQAFLRKSASGLLFNSGLGVRNWRSKAYSEPDNVRFLVAGWRKLVRLGAESVVSSPPGFWKQIFFD